MSELMPTVAVKKNVRKTPAKRSPATKPGSLRAVDENGRFILGYAKGVIRVRPGVDLTKPTLPPGKYFA